MPLRTSFEKQRTKRGDWMHIANRLPARIQDGIAFIGNAYFKFYRIKSFPYTSLSARDKEAAWIQRSQFFRSAVKNGLHAQLWVKKRKHEWEKEKSRLIAGALEKTAAEKNLEGWDRLIDYVASPEFEYILAVQLPVGSEGPVTIKESFVFGKRFLMKRLGFQEDGREYTKSEIEAVLKAAEEMENELPDWLLEPMESWEVYDFYRYHYFRGMNDIPIPEALKHDWPDEDSRVIAESEVEDGDGYVVIRCPGQERYISCIVPALISKTGGLTPPQDDLVHELVPRMLLELPYLDFTLHYRKMGVGESRRYVEKQALDMLDKMKHVAKARADEEESKRRRWLRGDRSIDLPEFDISKADKDDQIVKRYQEIRGLHQYLKNQESPMLECRLMFVVTARTKEEVQSKTRETIERLNNLNCLAVAPKDDQRALFESWFPAPQWEGYGYRKKLIPECVAHITMPGASEQIGDPTGIPMGFNRYGQVVRFDPPSAIQRHKNASWAVTGDQGAGKSHLLDELAVNMVIYRKARVTIWDLKPDRPHWVRDERMGFEGFPFLHHLIRRFILDGSRYPGILDPFKVVKDPMRAREIAISLIDQMMAGGDVDFDRQLALWEAGARVKELGTSARMKDLRNALKESGDSISKRLADFMGYCAEYPLGKLIFGEGGDLDLPEGPGLVLIQPEGLELPKERRPENILQGISLAVLNMLALFNLDYLFNYPGFSFGVYDEAWSFLNTKAGKQMADQQSRYGRAKNTGLAFASQSALDIPEDLMGLIGTYVCMGTTTDEETERALKYLNVPFSNTIRKELIEIAKSRPEEGEERQFSSAVVRDSRGRTARVDFITPDEDRRRMFDTKPESVSVSVS